MQIVSVSEFLSGADPDGPLSVLPLDALDTRRDPYRAMLLQPEGRLQASGKGVSHYDQMAAAAMCDAFLLKACELEADIVVAPEYCIPWATIRKIAEGAFRPRPGAIWVLGCQSTTANELDELRNFWNVTSDVRILHEPWDVRQRAQKYFVNPLIYVFWTTRNTGDRVLAFLIQFKTVACRDEGHFELSGLYVGKSVYRFSNSVNQIGLLGLICSDVFEFDEELIESNHRNTLIIHVQLNEKPAHAAYLQYRIKLFSLATNSYTELVCVNWGNAVAWYDSDKEVTRWTNIGGSGWYLPPMVFERLEESIESLHRSGVYYTKVSAKWSAFFLNYCAHAIVLEKQKVFVRGPQVLRQELTPSVISRWEWEATRGLWTATVADDGFSGLLSDYDRLGHLTFLAEQSCLAVERSLELLEGPAPKPGWYEIGSLDGFQAESDEAIRSITVHQDTDDRRASVRIKRQRLRRAQTVMGFDSLNISWLPSLVDLGDGFRFQWLPTSPHCNVVSTTAAIAATMIYLDEDPERARTEALYQGFRNLLRRHAVDTNPHASAADLAEIILRAADRLCVLFRRGTDVICYRPGTYASITDPMDRSSIDIAGT
jgi:hypothetical protein